MPKADDLVNDAELAAKHAKYFAVRCEERCKKLAELIERYKKLAALTGGSPGVDTAGEINLFLSVLSLCRATEVEYRKTEALSGEAVEGALSTARREAEDAVVKANGQKKKAEKLLGSGQILKEVTSQIDTFLDGDPSGTPPTSGAKKRIYARLEEFDKEAQDTVARTKPKGKGSEAVKRSSDMIFIAESLPIIQGIIHVATDRKSLGQAITWIRETWGETANSLIVLSALVFAYIAKRGASDAKFAGKHEVWLRIKERATKFSGS
jgi:hypothetical protein